MRKPDSGKPFERSLPSFAPLLFAIPRCGIRFQRVDQPMRSHGNFADRPLEHVLVGPRRPCGPAQLTDELQRRITDLLFTCRWLKVGQRLDVSAHAYSSSFLECSPYSAWQCACRLHYGNACSTGRTSISPPAGSVGIRIAIEIASSRSSHSRT